MTTYGWRAWSLSDDRHLQPLIAPSAFFRVDVPTATYTAWCAKHEPPAKGCTCGVYAMSDLDALLGHFRPCDAVTRVSLTPPVLQDTGLQSGYPGELRAKAATMVGPALLHPIHEEHVAELSDRYGIPFVVDERLVWNPVRQALDVVVSRLSGRLGALNSLLESEESHGAGLLLTNDTRTHVVLQKRSRWVDHPGTWALPGGLVEAGEAPTDAALREAKEEHASLPRCRVTAAHQRGTYTYVLATTDGPVPVDAVIPSTSPEAEGAGWVPIPAVINFRLHPGFEKDWPSLRGLIAKEAQPC